MWKPRLCLARKSADRFNTQWTCDVQDFSLTRWQGSGNAQYVSPCSDCPRCEAQWMCAFNKTCMALYATWTSQLPHDARHNLCFVITFQMFTIVCLICLSGPYRLTCSMGSQAHLLVCMSVCLSVCLYVCMYVYIYICIYLYIYKYLAQSRPVDWAPRQGRHLELHMC